MGIYSARVHNDFPGVLPYPQILIDLIITKTMAIFSFVPSIIIFITYFFIKKKNFQDTVALQLSISCIIHSASFLFPLLYNPINKDEDMDCALQAVFITTFDLISLSLTTSISFLAYKSFTEDENNELPDKNTGKKILSMWICWILPLVFGVLCFFYGNNHSGTTLVCFPRNKAIIILFLVISFIFFCCNMVSVFLLMKEVGDILDQDKNKAKVKYLLRVFAYFATQAITYGPFLADVILKLRNIYKNEKPEDKKKFSAGWDYFKDFTQCGTGLAFAIVYGFTRNIRKQLFLFRCCKSIANDIYNDNKSNSSGSDKSNEEDSEKKEPLGVTDTDRESGEPEEDDLQLG